MKKIYLLVLAAFYLLIFNVDSVAQSHFVPAWGANQNAEDYMTFLLAQVKVNGEDLTAGDEVGFFDGEYCVGVAVLTEGLQEVWDAFSYQAAAGIDEIDPINDPLNLEITGFTTGNSMSFKLWDASEEEEITAITADFYTITQLVLPPQTYSVNRKFVLALNAVHNYTPKARAGADIIIDETDLGELDGSTSSDKENSPLLFTWLDLDNLGISAPDVAKPSFTAPNVTADTDYRLVLTVSDGEKTSKPDTVIVTVKQVDWPPIANAGADFEVDEGDPGLLDGSLSSDPDGLPLTYSWTIVPAEIILDNATAAQTGFTAPMVENDREYLAVLTVTNSISLSDKDTVVIKVINYNLIPIANAGQEQEVNEGETIALDGSTSSDPDNAPNASLTYQWTSPQGVVITGANTAYPTAVAPFFLKDSVLHFVLVVNDGAANSEPDTVAITVKHKNLPPTAHAGIDFTVNEGENVVLNGTASEDLDGSLTFEWVGPVSVEIFNSNTATPNFTAPEVQADSVISFILVVTDNDSETDRDTVEVTITHINKKPVANAGPDQFVDEKLLITLDGSLSSDPDIYDEITYKWIAPAGISLTGVNTANPTFTSPVIVEEYRDYIFTLVVNDGVLDSDSAKVVIRIIHENLPPVADAGADFTIDENTDGNLDGTNSSDFEGKALTYSWTAPTGFVINNPDYYYPSFTAPNVEKDTTYTVVLVVNDGVWPSEPDTVLVTVRHINKAPVANAGTDQTVAENVLVTLDGSASMDEDLYDVLTFKWLSLDGASMDDDAIESPSFTTPMLMKDSVFRFVLTVNDGWVDSDPDTVAVLVQHANLMPTAVINTPLIINEGEIGTLNGDASSDPEGKTPMYSWTASGGLIIDNPTTVNTTYTAPEVEVDTDFEITLTVDDGQAENNTNNATITVTVLQVNKPPVAVLGPDFAIREQKMFTVDGSASYDPDALDNISFSWVNFATTESSFSVMSPATAVDMEMEFILTVTDDALLATGKDTLIVTVTPNAAPVANAGDKQTVNAEQTVTLHAEGSTDPDDDDLTYLWTAPAGIILTGETTANPTFVAPTSDDTETFIFMLEVTDDLGLTNSASVSVEVISNLPPEIVSAKEVYVWEDDSVTLDASESWDPNGDRLNFTWTHYNSFFRDKVILINPNDPQVSFIAPEVDELTAMTLRLKVSDGLENSVLIIRVYIKDKLNIAPLAHAGEDVVVNEREQGMLDGTASSDADGNPLTYLWSSDYLALDDVTSPTPAFVAPEVDADTTVWITLVVNDGKAASGPDSVQVTIKQVNRIPVADAGANVTVNEGEQISFDGSASYDPDGDELSYTWSAEGFSITDPNLVAASVTAPEVEKNTSVPVVLVVNDGELNSTPDTIWVTILQVNKMPVWVEVPADTVVVGHGYFANIIASDPDMLDVLSIFSDDLPEWLTITDHGDGTATISTDSVPDLESLLGKHTFLLKASDGTATIDTLMELIVTIGTGITDWQLAKVKFYPNPTHGKLNVEFDRMPAKETLLQVFNQLGQKVAIRRIDQQNSEIDLSEHPAGMYYIKVDSDGKIQTEKIILR